MCTLVPYRIVPAHLSPQRSPAFSFTSSSQFALEGPWRQRYLQDVGIAKGCVLRINFRPVQSAQKVSFFPGWADWLQHFAPQDTEKQHVGRMERFMML